MTQQLITAQAQLQQAKSTLQSMSGERGMQLLLSGTIAITYRPLRATLQRDAREWLVRRVESRCAQCGECQCGTDAAQLATLSPADQQRIAAARQRPPCDRPRPGVALQSSSRFAALQSLIPQSARRRPESHSRSSSEDHRGGWMLQNEQTKLQVLAQGGDAINAANAQRSLELSIVEQAGSRPAFSRCRDRHGILRHILELAQRTVGHVHRQQHGAAGGGAPTCSGDTAVMYVMAWGYLHLTDRSRSRS